MWRMYIVNGVSTTGNVPTRTYGDARWDPFVILS